MILLIRTADESDAAYIGEHMTEAAKREIAKMGEDPKEAVRRSVQWSDICNVLEMDGVPIMVYGVSDSILGTAKVWAIGTDDCKKCKTFMVRTGRKVASVFRNMYGKLENWCDADYASSLRWLKLIGFEVDSPEGGFCHLHIGG